MAHRSWVPHAPSPRSLAARLLFAAAPVALVVVLLVAWVAAPMLRTPGNLSRAEADLVDAQRYQNLLTLVDQQSLHWSEYQYLPSQYLLHLRAEMQGTTDKIVALERTWVTPPAAARKAFAAYAGIEAAAQSTVVDMNTGDPRSALRTLESRVIPPMHQLRQDLDSELLARSSPLIERFSELSGNVETSFLGAEMAQGLTTARYEIDQVLRGAQIEDLITREASEYAEMIATKDTGDLDAIGLAALVNRDLDRLQNLLATSGEELERPAVAFIRGYHAQMGTVGEQVRAQVRAGDRDGAAISFERRLDPLLLDQLVPVITTKVSSDRKELASEVAAVDARARQLRAEVAAGGLLLLLLLAFPIVLIARSTVRPLRKIRRAAEDISSGNLAARSGVTGKSEVGELAGAFDDMATRVEASRASMLSAAVLESSSDLLLIVREGEVSFASGASTSLLGLPPEAILHKPVTTLVHPEDAATLLAWHPSEGSESAAVQVRFATATGWVDCEIAIADLRDDPEVNGLVLSVRDVTARKQVEIAVAAARDAALEGSRMKSDFLATMSHEIRTPMNGVIGLTGLLLTTDLDERQVQYAQGVRGAGEALLAIINDILDFSKVEAGKLELEDIDFDLVQVVEEAAVLVADAAQQKGVELLAYCSPELPLSVRGDPSRIRQVLLNLISNAVKFTDHGEVVVRGHLEDSDGSGVVVRFEVTDTGAGIPEATRQRLFEPFTQADSSTTREFGGTGLGLAISHRLVTAMGGTIGLDSQVGAGSTFWFTLPLGMARDHVRAPVRATGRLTGLRALIVDDNQTNRLILTEQLGAWGVRTDAVEDGQTALRALREASETGQPYDLALLDFCMPVMDGLDLAGRISKDPKLGITGLLLLTSAQDVTLQQANEAGVSESLTKPVRLSQLHTALQTVHARSRATEPVTPATSPIAASETRGHVLVVEDNATNQLVAVGILESLGFTAEVAANGLEALQAMSRRPFAAVLMDCHMPVMDGYTATGQIRRDEGTGRHTTIIAMTAGAIQGDRERCLASGMDDYVSKPVIPHLLDAVLAHWLETPDGRARLDAATGS